MFRRIIMIGLSLVLLAAGAAAAGDADTKKADQKKTDQKKMDTSAKALSGMSIVGNDEAPKSLYIVPWKSSELGVETTLSTKLNDGDMPVDRDVFKRQLEFYQVSTGKE